MGAGEPRRTRTAATCLLHAPLLTSPTACWRVAAALLAQVLVLGSIEATQRRDEQLVGPQLRCWAPDSSGSAGGAAGDAAGSAAELLLGRCRGAAGVPLLEASFWQGLPLEARCLPPWPLLRALHCAGVPTAALLCFSSEGDNVADGLMVATATAAALDLQARGGASNNVAGSAAGQWVPPPGWQCLYGATAAVY